ncbi:MAG: anti-virulence regulator CigR family protein [Marivibrio sp.]|uniref:anti-virulence regulator CigR family protein n=1 Tax=Marivibrio sp. TaxID=2039719 RepID=UPI0032EE5261
MSVTEQRRSLRRAGLSVVGVAMTLSAFALSPAPQEGSVWLSLAPAYAKSDKAKGGPPEGQGKPARAGGGAEADDAAEERLEDEIVDEVLDGVFGEDERDIIERYARERELRPTDLPPGIAKNVARGKPLPPGIAKRGLPSDLEGRLPPLREGLERIIVGDDVTIVEEGTRIVVDVLKDVLTGQ